MSSKSSLTSFDRMMKDLFPRPGEPAKEWVIKARAARASLERTGARIAVPDHLDNTGARCREVGPATLLEDCRTHDCCYFCNKLGGDE